MEACIYVIAACGGNIVYILDIFHALLTALQPVAAGMKRGKANCISI
jgi:sugar phosphate isomerase/epimerase